jgi:hypothetical protein
MWEPSLGISHMLRTSITDQTIENHCVGSHTATFWGYINQIERQLEASHFLTPWKDTKSITLPKPGKNPTFPQNLLPISLLPTTGKLFEKVILKVVQRHNGERGLLNVNQFGFHASHNTTLQCTRLTDHVTLNFNNNMPTAAIFLDIKKAFDTTWHVGLLYKLINDQAH